LLGCEGPVEKPRPELGVCKRPTSFEGGANIYIKKYLNIIKF
jgi:hypothetical protein